jgi:hypothetical protein
VLAEAILAQNFTAITRAGKKRQEEQEQDRDGLLAKITEKNSRNIIERKLDEDEFSV